ncbi:MAG: ComEA family DNA-binding protein [Chitinispirillaceae bacterium]|nr:ComEA family DNA-binding protein [Chitinispirillaceae bacterium]
MKVAHFPFLLWVLCVVLWSIVVVDRCRGDDGVVTTAGVQNSVVAAPETSFSGGTEPSGAAVSRVDACINVNSASADELTALPGIGPVIAGRMIDFREKNGPFARLADLDMVKGIGPATLRKLEKKVCF